MNKKVIDALNKASSEGKNVALVTITNKVDSGPRGTGSSMVVDADGNLLAGTIGGGAIEQRAKKDAKECLRKREAASFSYELSMENKPEALGMACGGAAEVFVNVYIDSKKLIIFGGGHIGLTLSEMAKSLGYFVTVVDHRDGFATKERLPWADEVHVGSPEQVADKLDITEQTAIVIVTHGHVFDADALKAVIDTKADYIGMIGSFKKIKYCFDKLIEEGISKEKLQTVFAPIGLDIGGESPEEIALAILAEIQANNYGKTPVYLRDRDKELIWK